MKTTETCDRCRLLQTECWRLAQRLADLEQRLAHLAEDLDLTRWVAKRLAQTVGARALAHIVDPDPEDEEPAAEASA
jgi:hypothetical protein